MLTLANYSEEEITAILTDIGNKLANKFKFGCYEKEDIQQEVYFEGIKLLSKYDGKRPLANFLFFSIRNRLKNLRRNKYERLESPCQKCPFNAFVKESGTCTKFEKMLDCDLYYKFAKRNSQKKQLMHSETVDFYTNICNRGIGEGENDLSDKEINEYIDANLPVQYRADYLKLKSGDKLTAQRREFIEDIVLAILTEGGYV